MTCNPVFVVLLCTFSVLFLILFFVNTKLSIKDVFKNYFFIYFGGYNKEKDKRVISILYLLSIGLLPYVIGVFLVLSFYSNIKRFDSGVLSNIDTMLLAIFAIFFGFDIFGKKSDNTKTKNAVNETNATLMFSIVLLLSGSIILLISDSLVNEDVIKILLCIYYAIKVKVFVLLIYILHNVYNLNRNDSLK